MMIAATVTITATTATTMTMTIANGAVTVTRVDAVVLN